MRIAHVITGLGMGGAERVLLDLCSEFSTRGLEIVIFSMTDDVAATTRGVHDSVTIKTLGITRNPISWITGGLRFVRGIRRFGPDVVHAHMYHALLLTLVARVLLPKRKPLVFTSHTSVVQGTFRKLFFRATRGLRSADIVFNRDQHYEINSENVVVIPNGVPAHLHACKASNRKRGEDRPWRFVNVGRFSEPKNQLVLLEQFAKVVDKKIDGELWLIGDGPMREEIVATARRLEITARVNLFGARVDVMELLADCDVFVLSSKWEGLPIALLEAGLAELPVISTGVGSVPELLGGGCGRLAPADRLGNEMCNLIARYGDAIEMGKRLGARVREHYSVRAMAEAHTRLYSRLVDSLEMGALK